MAKRYVVQSEAEEQERLRGLTRRGKTSARQVRRAQTLLLADAGRTDEQIATALQAGLATIARCAYGSSVR
jgi:hypothetical protein